MTIGKIVIIITITIIWILTYLLFCIALLSTNTKEDELLNEKEQEEYLKAWNEAQKLKLDKRNRRNNEREKSN